MTTANAETEAFDVAVVGAGPAGLCAAILFARLGLSTALIAPAARPDDVRTTALLGGSVSFFQTLGLWDAIALAGADLAVMRLIDDTGRLIRAPEATFRAAEIGRDSFGVNIVNAALTAILDQRIATTDVARIEATVEAAELGGNAATLTLSTGARVTARLVVAADGKKSKLREAAGIGTTAWAHPQSALVLNLAHPIPHDHVSTEFHGPSGPFVLVPLPGKRSSVVLVERPEEAERLKTLPDAALALELERRAHSLLGRFTVEPGRQVWPLSSMIADSHGRARVALIGEAAHTFPPIGAQGLNLSLRDIASLAEIVADADRAHRDIGGDETLRAYEKARRLDVETRARGVDIANRALLSELLPVQALRSLGFALATRIAPLRRLMMKEGLTPSWSTPRLMRGLDIASR